MKRWKDARIIRQFIKVLFIQTRAFNQNITSLYNYAQKNIVSLFYCYSHLFVDQQKLKGST